ncbi:MAG TPA: long-chain fatty acid--CoA ligase [Candidatus Acidoferrum sp.]|jgi:long-chain acyl-CoA synthetase|nr:long-chain fatty acid--CoA ligase [Candidatus Acidoferrum sp.]
MSVRTSDEGTADRQLNPDAIAERTTVGVLFRQAARYLDRPLLHYPDGKSWRAVTWAEMRRGTLAVASALVEAGVKAGDHVVLMGPNSLAWLYCDFGIQAAGAISVPIYSGTVPEVAQAIAANCDAALAIVSDSTMASKLTLTETLKSIVTIDSDVAGWLGDPPRRLGDVVERLEAIKPDDVCTIVYTSGTTGDPKGAELAHRSLVDVTRSVIKVHPLSETDFTLSWLPYSHVFERINGTFTVLMFGGQMWLSGVDRLADDLADVQPTILLSVPRVYEKMHSRVMDRVREAPGFRRALFNWAVGVGTRFSHEVKPGRMLKAEHGLAERLVLGPLRERLVGGGLRFFISGGAALAREIEEFFWAIGVPILNGWGMTETSSGACSNTLTQHRFLTVGKPFPGIELKIEKDGEILVNSPGNMLGYHKNPVATADTLDHGWIRTGDIGEIDADGFLKITDRKKDLIKTAGGKYVAPQQLEFEIQRDDLIEQAVVIGESRPYVTALIVPDWAAVTRRVPGRPENLVHDERVIALIDMAVDAVNKRVGSWEAIKYFTLLPRAFTEEAGEITSTLKIKRKVVAQKYADRIESMYEGRKKPA